MKLDALLPHRPPFRFIDEVVSIEADSGSFALELGSGDPRLAPGDILMPTFLVEAMAQGAAAYHGHQLSLAGNTGRESGVLSQIDSARFYATPMAGDRIVIRVARTHQLGALVRFSGVATRDDEVLAEAHLTVARTVNSKSSAEPSAEEPLP